MGIVRGKTGYILLAAAIVAAGAAVRLHTVLNKELLFGDTAVMGLMSKRILELKEFPIYLWKAHYAGPIGSYIGALWMAVFGVSADAFNSVGVLFAVVWVIGMFLLARKLTGRYGSFAALALLAFPPYLVMYYSTATSGLSENLCIAAAIFWCLFKLVSGDDEKQTYLYPLLGFISSFGLWVHPSTMSFSFLILLVFFFKDKRIFISRRFLYFMIGFVIAYIPAIIYNVQYPHATFNRMAARFLQLDKSVLQEPDFKMIILRRLAWRLTVVPAKALFNLPWTVISLMGVVNTAFLAASVIWVWKSGAGKLFGADRKMNFTGALLMFVPGFIFVFCFLVSEPKSRQMLPLYVVYPIFMGMFLTDVRKRSALAAAVILAVALGYNVYSIGDRKLNHPAPHYTQLAGWLEKHGCRDGFSDYEVAYSVIMASNERVLVSPTIFSLFFERRPEYTAEVRRARNVVYILPRGKYPKADGAIGPKLDELGITYKKDEVYEFTVYHGLSRKILPEQLALPEK